MSEDRRTKYTKKVLKDSLVELLKTKPIERISVKEICERADINRSTFYVYYASPTDLLNGIKNEMYNEIKSMEHNYENIEVMMLVVLNTFMTYRELLSVLIKSMDNIGFIYNMLVFWKPDFETHFKEAGVSENTTRIAYNFILAGAASTIVMWALGDYAESAESVAKAILLMAGGCANAVYKDMYSKTAECFIDG